MTTPALQERFQTLVDEHRKILYKVCNSYCWNRDDREDLAQEIVIQLWQSFGSFDERCRFSTWMYRICLNVAISFYRRESTRTRYVLSDEEHLLNAIDETANQPAEIQALYQFIDGLDSLKKALVLLYLDGNSYLEIADVLGIRETNVATKISRLKQTMRHEFRGTVRVKEEKTMLDLDELKHHWAEHDRKLDGSIRLSRQLLSATNLNGARSAMQRMAAFLGLEAAVWFAIVMALGSFIYEHIGILQFAVPAVASDVFAIGMLIAAIRQIVAARQIDYGRPIASIQKQLETLRVLRIRTTQWGLLAGVIVWAPFAIVVAKAFFGLDSYSTAWLWANVLFGLSLIPLALWLSKKYGNRMGWSPFIQRLMNDIAGHNLTAAKVHLARLSEFEGENPGR